MPGDSGGPLYTGGDAGISDVLDRGAGDITIPIDFSDSLSAVFVGGTLVTGMNGQPVNPLTIAVGSTQWGVPIDQGIYNWLNNQPWLEDPQTIPEPSTWIMALVATAIGVLIYRRRGP